MRNQLDHLIEQPNYITLISPEIQPSPITLPQIYYHFSNDLLLPEIAQHILSLQLGDTNLAKIEQSSKSPEHLVKHIETLIHSCEYLLASEVCTWFFHHAKISICDIQDLKKNTSLHLNKNTKVAQILIKIAGNNAYTFITMQNINGWTALHSPAMSNNVEMVKLLLDMTGDDASKLTLIQTTEGWTALHDAVYHDSIKIVELLLTAASDKKWTLLAIQDTRDWTALHQAAYYNCIESIKLLLNAANNKAQDLIMIPDNIGRTALDLANPEIKKVMQEYMNK